MKTYRQIVENVHPRKAYKRFLILGIAYLIVGIFLALKQSNFDIWHNLVWIITGTGFIVVSFFHKNKGNNLYIVISANGIEANLNYLSTLNIKWDEIKAIDIKPISITLLLNSNESKEISLGSFYYAKVIEIKTKLKEFANEKKIEIV